jgi:ribose-phosphate pyrophosphokinase
MITLNLVYPEKSDIKYIKTPFPDGQQNITIKDDNFIHYSKEQIVTISSRLNNWLDLELIVASVACLRDLKVKEIHLYTPYIIGARSDRKFEEGGNNYLKDVICPVINSLNFKTVTCIDPHSDVLEACIKGFRKESNLELCHFTFKNIYGSGQVGPFTDPKFILVSPDAGASKKIYKLAEQIGYKGDIITCSKDRDENGKLTKCIIPLDKCDYYGKDFIIIDDICDGGNTFINIMKELKDHLYLENKDSKFYLIVTHGIFSKGFDELSKYFDGIYCTNSYRDLPEYIMTNKSKKFPSQEKTINLVKQLKIF